MSLISIIIPAHNEAAVIARCIQSLRGTDTELLVVCNGCTDATAQLARDAAGDDPSIRVLETPVPSKINALNLGDAAARGFPRFYVDADVVLPRASMLKIAERLRAGPILAAAPKPTFDLRGASWAVRAFYRINTALPSINEGIGGSGVYALSEQGRGRFGAFPTLTADDGFVRVQFTPGERATFADCASTVFAPRTLKELLAIKTRSHYGTMELRARYPHLWANKGADNAGALRRLLVSPANWIPAAVYIFVKLEARRRARRRLAQRQMLPWDRDETSRSPVASGPQCD